MNLLEEFIKKGILGRSQAEKMEKEIGTEGKTLDKLLIDLGVEQNVLDSIKQEYFSSITFRPFDPAVTPPTLLKYMPEKTALRYGMVPLALSSSGVLEVGMLDPDNIEAKSILQFISSDSGIGYEIFLIGWNYYDHIIANYSGVKGEVKEALGELDVVEELESEGVDVSGDELEELIKEDAPITKIVNNVLRFAAEKRASDVHIEPKENEIIVRYRVDGVLEKGLSLPKKIQPAVVARIKILSKIKLDERRVPQDGRFSVILLKRKIDFRVSTFPTYHGEKIVIRLLEANVGARSLEEIGLRKEHLITLKKVLAHTYGIVLICGPTGSGKTSTLYSFLDQLDKEKKNILSLENPIELNVDGVSQSQVRPEIGYTFASGLRSVLRQDPDIIMVGEIRDTETAQLAIQAALTGHLVLSTIHTNTAADAIPRLIDMGVDAYLIGPTLIATIGQRLVRTFAPDIEPEVVNINTNGAKDMIKKEISDLPQNIQEQFLSQDTVYKAVPTKEYPTGLKGRLGAFEILETTKEIQKVILENSASAAIFKKAREQGMISMREDAILKALEKKIPIEEAWAL